MMVEVPQGLHGTFSSLYAEGGEGVIHNLIHNLESCTTGMGGVAIPLCIAREQIQNYYKPYIVVYFI